MASRVHVTRRPSYHRVGQRHRRTVGAVNLSLTEAGGPSARPFWDTGTCTVRKAVTDPDPRVTAFCRPDVRWAARPVAASGHRARTAVASRHRDTVPAIEIEIAARPTQR